MTVGSTARRLEFRGICAKLVHGHFLQVVKRFSQSVKEKALQMYRNNVGIRKIALFVGASPPSVLEWIRKAGNDFSKRLASLSIDIKDDVPDIIEMDKILHSLKKQHCAVI